MKPMPYVLLFHLTLVLYCIFKLMLHIDQLLCRYSFILLIKCVCVFENLLITLGFLLLLFSIIYAYIIQWARAGLYFSFYCSSTCNLTNTLQYLLGLPLLCHELLSSS